MDTPESNVHSFIVKLWLEGADDETDPAAWHGFITHVPSGQRRYLREFGDILGFIKGYVEIKDTDPSERLHDCWLTPWRRSER
jgi:hypothetical protein